MVWLFFKNSGTIFKYFYWKYVAIQDHERYGYFGKNAYVGPSCSLNKLSHVYLYDNVAINSGANIISNVEYEGRFIVKKNSGAACGLTVVIGNHPMYPEVGKWHRESYKQHDTNRDVVVEEDVWIAANVTLLSGVTVGRGAIVGAGSVCRNSPPPYSIVAGNPAKVIGFKYTPEEII